MKKKILPLILLIMFALCSCMHTDRSLELKLCGAYAVPGMFDTDLKGTALSVDVIEEDKQGRILFELTSSNAITGERETVLVICRSIDSEYVYYYEDQCYLYQNHTESDITSLKKQNDWDLPLNQEKMSSRPNEISLDLCIVPNLVLEREKVRNAIVNELGNIGAVLIDYCLLDVNPNGYELHWITATANGTEANCLAIISPDYEIAFSPVTEYRMDPNEVAALKYDNGWFSSD